jgi:integrase
MLPTVSHTESKLSGINFSTATAQYLALKGVGKEKYFTTYTMRNSGYLIACLGDQDLMAIPSSSGGKFRDALVKRGLASSSIKRIFTSVRSIVSLAISEHGLDTRNPFANVYFPERNDTKRRLPISANHIKQVQQSCMKMNDDKRHLLCLISDTGLRLSEAVGLRTQDIHLNTPIPYLSIQENEVRRLKTKQSKRDIPLVGASLWAATAIKETADTYYAFPRYTKEGQCNANSASAALNKWLQSQVNKDAVCHSFRHSLRDRLRAVQCPSDITDAIGGWATTNIGQGYGTGYRLDVLHEWMRKIAS